MLLENEQKLEKRRRRQRGSRRKQKRGLRKRIPIMVSGAVIITAAAAGIALASSGPTTKPLASKALATKPPAPKTRPPQPSPIRPPSSWQLAFNPSFQGDALDTSVFATCYPWSDAALGCTNTGNSSDSELEWYQAAQDQVSGGELHLVAQRQPTSGVGADGKPEEFSCRSGMVTTYPGFQFEYGLVQVVAKIPFGQGLWPAIWLAAANEKWPPEIDILEHWHGQAQGKVYLHPLSGARQGGAVSTPDLAKGFHTFALKWTSTELTWYYDGKQVYHTTTGVPRQAMYLIMNVADDVGTPGSCAGSMDIKSVEVWRP